ncbi:MAG TPA: glutaredoxin domain-containing protein [Pseudogracilibacillus sp.]|nr:glutaredoxin domain-containing protein [Pseudogracilibacillus sp.]
MARPTATVYMTDTCPYCTMMIRHLREKDIRVRTVNIQKDERAAKRLMATTGQLGVPQTELNGKWILGFDPNSVEQALRG